MLLPIGTGPYKFVSRASGDNVKLAAFDQYYRGEAAIKDLTFKVITDATAQIAAVQKGEIDFLTHAPLSAKQTVLDDSNLSWEETDIRGTIFLVMNHNVAPFDNELVRKAVQCGVSKENMIIGGAEGMGTPLNTMFPTSITGSPEADYTAPYTYDLEKAKSYMKEAGYRELHDGVPVEHLQGRDRDRGQLLPGEERPAYAGLTKRRKYNVRPFHISERADIFAADIAKPQADEGFTCLRSVLSFYSACADSDALSPCVSPRSSPTESTFSPFSYV